MEAVADTRTDNTTVPEKVRRIGTDRRVKLDYLAKGIQLFGSPTGFWQMERDVKNDALRSLIRLAREEFGGGLKFDLDESDIHKLFGSEKHSGNRVDIHELPIAEIWKRIEAKYGNGVGEKRAKQELAIQLIREFGLRGEPPVFKKDCLVLNQSVAMCSIFPGRLSTTSSGYVQSILNSLATWAGTEEQFSLQSEIQKVLTELRSFQREVVTRETFECMADDKRVWVRLVTFQKRFEYTLSPALSTRFQAFIATYGAEYLADR